ncbi:hypothetical protein TNCV_2438681 [Trichonephila clavipes]|nr:hypothetical protein TNCV_2438681 [Trichonephila clavipes]
MHDGASMHFSIAALNHLHATYPERWIGLGGPFTRTPRSPDLNLDSGDIRNHLCMRRRSLQRKISRQTSSALFEGVRDDPVSSVGYATSHAAETSNNSCDNHLSLHFFRQAVMHCSYCKHAFMSNKCISYFLLTLFIPLDIKHFITVWGNYSD